VHVGHRSEDGLRLEVQLDRGFLELVREHVDQHLRIRAGVDVPQIRAEHLVLELRRIGQVAVVAEHDAERRVHVERLGLGRLERRPRGRIAAVRDAHVAAEIAHVPRAEDVAHHARRLVHVEHVVLGRDDARGVLPAMLQQQQPVIEQLVDGGLRDDAEDPAHGTE